MTLCVNTQRFMTQSRKNLFHNMTAGYGSIEGVDAGGRQHSTFKKLGGRGGQMDQHEKFRNQLRELTTRFLAPLAPSDNLLFRRWGMMSLYSYRSGQANYQCEHNRRTNLGFNERYHNLIENKINFQCLRRNAKWCLPSVKLTDGYTRFRRSFMHPSRPWGGSKRAA